MEPIYYTDKEYIVTMPSANIISGELNLYGAENVLVGGLVRPTRFMRSLLHL